MVGVWVGTGVGGGIVLGGTIFHGDFGTAGEIGQTVVAPRGGPGARILEDFSSRTGMSRLARERIAAGEETPLAGAVDDDGIIGAAAFADALSKQDAVAEAVVDEAAIELGTAIANLVTVLSVNTVVIGGGVTETLGKPWLARIRRAFDAAVFPDALRRCAMRPTELADNAGLLGAADLARRARVI
jgi:glucokinase